MRYLVSPPTYPGGVNLELNEINNHNDIFNNTSTCTYKQGLDNIKMYNVEIDM